MLQVLSGYRNITLLAAFALTDMYQAPLYMHITHLQGHSLAFTQAASVVYPQHGPIPLADGMLHGPGLKAGKVTVVIRCIIQSQDIFLGKA